MNKTRIQEIASSPVMAEVTYNGIAVYIESVDAINHTASIHFMENPETKQEVPIEVLREEDN